MRVCPGSMLPALTLFLLAISGCHSPTGTTIPQPEHGSSSSERRGADDLATGGSKIAPPLPLPELPTRRHGHRAHWVGETVYVFGGTAGARVTSADRQTLSWSPSDAAWSERGRLNHRKNFFASVVVDGQLYAIGENIEQYDAAADRWNVVPTSHAFPKSHFAAAAIGRTIYTVGGFPVERGALTAFDLDSRTARSTPSLPGLDSGAHFHFMANLDGHLHVLGGLTGETTDFLDTHWRLRDGTWVERAPLPAPDAAKFAIWTVHRNQLYLFGMECSHRYDPGTDQWTPLAKPPELRAMPATFAHGDHLYVLGGFPPRAARGILVYAIPTDSWSRLRE